MEGSQEELLNIFQLGSSSKRGIIVCAITLIVLGFLVKAFLLRYINSKAKAGPIDKLLIFELHMRNTSLIIGLGIIFALMGWKGQDFGVLGHGICAALDMIFLFNIGISIYVGAGISILRLMYIYLGIGSRNLISTFAQHLPLITFLSSVVIAVFAHIFPVYQNNFYMDLCLGHEKRFYKNGKELEIALIIRRVMLLQGIAFILLEMTSYLMIFIHLARHDRVVARTIFKNNATIPERRRRRNLISFNGHFSTHIMELLFLLCTYLAESLLPEYRTLIIEVCSLMFPSFTFLVVPTLQILSSDLICRYFWTEFQRVAKESLCFKSN